MAQVQLTAAAERDFEQLIAHAAQRDQEAASELGAALLETMERLAAGELPARDDQIEGVQRPVKSWLHRPYRIFFEVVPGGIRVLRIYHGARAPIRNDS